MSIDKPREPGRFSVERAKDAVNEAHEGVDLARRDFMKIFGYGGISLMAACAAPGESISPSPYASSWNFAPGLLYMNVGTTGASPVPVVQEFNVNYENIASDPVAYFFGQQNWRNQIVPGFGCDPFELVMSFNTTDSCCRIMTGLEWNLGDEIITTNMEEISGIGITSLLADRYGVVLKQVQIPTNDAYSDDEVLSRFEAQRTSQTKAVFFSSPVYLTGTRLPEKQICAWAASHGIVSIVDGAHLPGMIALNLHDMGCDFMAGAGHKWQCGPGQTGFMYVRNGFTPSSYIRQSPTGPLADYGFIEDGIPTVGVSVPGYTNTSPLPPYWPMESYYYGQSNSILQNGHRDPDDNVAALLQFVGNGSRPSQNALAQCCGLWDGWGRVNIENYLVSLAQYLRARLVDIWGPQSLSFPYTAGGSQASQIGLTSFNPFSPAPDFDYNYELTAAESKAQAGAAAAALSELSSAHNIVLRTTTVPYSLRGDPTQSAGTANVSTPLRVSTHLFHSTADVDRLINALLQVVPHP